MKNGEIGFCSCNNLCSENQGDCDFDYQCHRGYRCRSNTCPSSLGFGNNTDCCQTSTIGDEDFCTTDEPCGVDEGHCDGNDECSRNDLVCGSDNCPSSLGYSSAIDCCEPKGNPFIDVYSMPLNNIHIFTLNRFM